MQILAERNMQKFLYLFNLFLMTRITPFDRVQDEVIFVGLIIIGLHRN